MGVEAALIWRRASGFAFGLVLMLRCELSVYHPPCHSRKRRAAAKPHAVGYRSADSWASGTPTGMDNRILLRPSSRTSAMQPAGTLSVTVSPVRGACAHATIRLLKCRAPLKVTVTVKCATSHPRTDFDSRYTSAIRISSMNSNTQKPDQEKLIDIHQHELTYAT